LKVEKTLTTLSTIFFYFNVPTMYTFCISHYYYWNTMAQTYEDLLL